MIDSLANPTDTAICRLLAAGPLPTAALAARPCIPERTARHRLDRLRQAGAVVTGIDGLHHLAAPATTAPIAGPLPAGDSQATTGVTDPLPAGAALATTAAIAGALPPPDGAAMPLPRPSRLPTAR